MFFIVKAQIALRDRPDDTAPHAAGFLFRDDRVEKMDDGPGPDWVKVRLVGGLPTNAGFVHLADLSPDVPATAIDRGMFTTAVSLAARKFEGNPYYLYALAVTQSNITNTPDPDGSATGFGPFRFTPERWSNLVAADGVRTGAKLVGRDDPIQQVAVAAADENRSAAALQAKLGRLPQANELYLAFLFGDQAGLDFATAPAPTRADQILSAIVAPADVAPLLARYSALLQPGGIAATAAQVLSAAAVALQPGLDQAGAASADLDPPYDEAQATGPTPNESAAFAPTPPPTKFTGSQGVAAQTLGILKAAGWTHEQACGLIANIQAESNFKINVPGDGGMAYGICQWHPDRQKNFADRFGHTIKGSSLEQQLAFVTFELTAGKETAAGKRLKAQTEAGAAGWVVARYYERPASSDEWSRRAGIARSFATLLA